MREWSNELKNCFVVSSVISVLLCCGAFASDYRATLDFTDTQEITAAVPYIPAGAPAWFDGLWIGNGALSGSGWAATNLTSDALFIELNSTALTNDLALTVDFFDSLSTSNLLVRICDTNLIALTTNMVVSHATPMALTLDSFTTISNFVAVITSTSTSITVQNISISIDQDLDGLDEGEEDALGTSDFLKDSDGDGYNDLYEYLVGTDPTESASAPTSQITIVRPSDATVEDPGSTGVDTLGSAFAFGNGFAPVISYIDEDYPDLKKGLLAAFRLDGFSDFGIVCGYGSLCLTGNVYGASAGTAGRVGTAFTFNGLRQSVILQVPESMNQEPQYSPVPPGMPQPTNINARFSFSVSTWIRPQVIDGFRNIFAHGYQLSPPAELVLRIRDGRYEFQSWRGSSGVACVSCDVPIGDIGRWVHLTGVFDGASWRLYRNGTLAASLQSDFPPPVFDGPWAIGAAGNGLERCFNGDIDELCIWNRALTSAEVDRIWTAGNDNIGAASLLFGFDREWTAAHPSGYPAVSEAQAVRVVDTIPPTMLAPQDVILEEPSDPLPSVTGTPSVFDSSDMSPLVFNSDRKVPYPSSLVFWYPFDEAAGSTKFIEGLGRGCGYAAGAVSSGITGISGNAVSFDGALDRISLGGCEALSSLVSEFTVSCWVKPTVLSSSVDSVLTADKGGWAFGFYKGRLRFNLCGFKVCETTVPVETGEWSHIAASYDTNMTVCLYFNGVQVSVQSNSVPFSPASGGWFIGGAGNYDRCFSGAIDDVAVWNTVRTPQQITALYMTGLKGMGAALVDSTGIAASALMRNWIAADHAAWEISGFQWIFLYDLTPPSISAPADFIDEHPSPVSPDVTGWPLVSDDSDPAPSVSWVDEDNALSRGLLLRLLMEQEQIEGAVTVRDESGWYTVSGTPVDTVTVKDGLPPGRKALSFNGTSSRLSLGNPDHMNVAGPFSISAWVRPLASHGIHNILVHGFASNPFKESGLRIIHGKYNFYSYDGTDHGVSVPVPAEDIGSWVHLTGTCNGHIWRLYRNGKLLATAVDEFGAMSMSENWGVGCRVATSDRLYRGDIRQVSLWDRALFTCEVAELYRLESEGGMVAHDLPLPEEGLALYLPLNEILANSVVADISTNALTPLLSGAPLQVDSALQFNGTNDWIAIGNPDHMNFAGAFSICAWVKPFALSMSGLHNILGHGHRFNPNADTGLRINNGRYTFYSWDGLDHGISAAVPESNVNGEWLHVAGTYDGTTWRLYYDGDLIVSRVETNTGAVAMSADWAVGARGNGTSRFFAGQLRGVGLWNRALERGEIKAVRSSTLSSADPGFDTLRDRHITRSWTVSDFAGNTISAEQHITVSGAKDVDTDGEGLLDLEEGFAGTDIDKTDTDGDGLSDYEEVVLYGTDPLKKDTDGDGMPDKWEVDNGTEPLIYDAWADPDRDGLYNFDEFLCGTDPQLYDTDGDGINDGVEVMTAYSDPLAVDFDGTQTQVGDPISGASFIASTGSWNIENGSACARERSGSLVYILATTNPPADAVAFTVTQWNIYTAQDRFDLSLEVDGLFCGRVTAYAAYGESAQALFFLPALDAGSHSFRLTWHNNNANTFLQVNSLAFVNLDGPDDNSNGLPDWKDVRLGNVWHLEPVAELSYVSPLCVEGSGRFIDDVLVYTENSITQTVSNVSKGVGDRWFTDLALDPSTNTTVQIEGIESSSSVAFDVEWSVFDLAAPPTNAYILRTGDALLLGAESSTAVTVSNTLSTVSTNWIFSAEPVPFTFETPGDYIITSVTGGTYVAGLVAVRAVNRNILPSEQAVLIGREFTFASPNLTPDSEIEHDDRLTLTCEDDGGTPVLGLTTWSDKEMGIVARLPDGPVVDSSRVVPVYADAGDYWRVTQTYPDGTRLVEVALRLGAFPEGLEIKLNIFVSMVTFEDGTLTKTLTAADFDEDGVCKYRLLLGADSTTSVCHTTHFYQNGVYLGSYGKR